MRRDSWRSVPRMNRPPASRTFSASGASSSLCLASAWENIFRAWRISSLSVSAKPVASAIISSDRPALRRSFLAKNSALPPSMMSVPRPAMLVATVTAPNLPAWATISASFSWFLALRTLCLMPCLVSSFERTSDFSMEVVPAKTGCPFSWQAAICRTMAWYLPVVFLYTSSGWSTRIRGLLVGTSTMSSW